MSLQPGGAQPPPPQTLREYAVLADGERGLLVGPRGDFCWLCFPRWDSDAVFSSLIGGRGSYSVTPRGRFVWGGCYEPGGLIWRDRWTCDDGSVIECREALALPARRGRAVILRRILAVAETARVRVLLDPSWRFGADPLREVRRAEDGLWRGRTGPLEIAWSGGAQAVPSADGRGGHALELVLDVSPGEHHDLVLVVSLDGSGDAPPDADAAWRETETGWQRRVPRLEHNAAPRDARHAYAVLAGLTGEKGGMVAAATTSLPERAREGRNYDYRYVWIRDQCYAGQAVARDGPHPLMDDAVRFVSERLLQDGSGMRPAYTVDAENVPEVRSLDLPGYPGGCDQVGNGVSHQFQLDVFGEALLLFTAAARHDHLDADSWRAIEIAARAIEERRDDPDAGIWELQAAHWTHSRLICSAGLRAISELSLDEGQRASWLALAEALVADASTHALHPSGRWQRAKEDPRVDAALLMPAVRGAIPAEDPRALATLTAVEQELTQDGYCYRYRPDERPLGEAEGAFLLCGYMMVLAHSQQGHRVAAARWLERNRAACGPPGLFSEEYDVTQRQLRGNLPQAFVHALLLECAIELSENG